MIKMNFKGMGDKMELFMKDWYCLIFKNILLRYKKVENKFIVVNIFGNINRCLELEFF